MKEFCLNNTRCQKLSLVEKALKSGNWNSRIRAHLTECAECREEMQIRKWMTRLGSSLPSEPVPVTPQLIWIKAKLAEKKAAHAKALRPILFFQTGMQLIAGIGIVAFLFLNWRGLEGWFKHMSNGVFWLPAADDFALSVAGILLLIGTSVTAVFRRFALKK